MEDMKKLLKKEMGDDKQILRRMRLCFLPDKKVSKSTQVEDADFPEEEDEEDEEEEDMDGDISDDSQESVSLLAEAKKHRYMQYFLLQRKYTLYFLQKNCLFKLY